MAHREEPYHVLTITDADAGVTWNGHTWPRSYTCEVERVASRGAGYLDADVYLTCGHVVDPTARFCPSCGRAVVVRV